MSELFLLTNAAEPPPEILPALGLLLHTVRTQLDHFQLGASLTLLGGSAIRDTLPHARSQRHPGRD